MEIQKATKAEEPGGYKVTEGGSDMPQPKIVELKSAGYPSIWDTRTGERSVTNNNMLPAQLRKRRLDGSFVFTTIDPQIRLSRGTLTCMLHPDSAERAYYDTLGLPVCKKSNLTSEFHVRRHMKSRHKVEFETIEERKQTAKEERATRLQESLIMAVGGKLPIITHPVATEIPEGIVTTSEIEMEKRWDDIVAGKIICEPLPAPTAEEIKTTRDAQVNAPELYVSSSPKPPKKRGRKKKK